MRSVHFRATGFDRTYWDFFVGFNLFVTVLMLSAALFTWQMEGLPAKTLATLRLTAWGLAGAFGVVTWLSYRYFFWVPVVFAAAIFVSLSAAACVGGNPK